MHSLFKRNVKMLHVIGQIAKNVVSPFEDSVGITISLIAMQN